MRSLPEELLVVEGRAAANAVRAVRDRATQDVYAVQGKPINAARARSTTVRANERADELVRRVTRNRSAEFDPLHQPYQRVVLLTDGDVDGVHAKALLLVLLDELVPELIGSGRLFTVRAPQFLVTWAEGASPAFAHTLAGRDSLIQQLQDQGATRIRAKHFKGLASMNAELLAAVCVNPSTRQCTPLTAAHAEAARAALGG